MELKILRKGKQQYQLRVGGVYDNMTPAEAKRTAAYIRKEGGLCRVIKKPTGLYQIWVNSPFSFSEIELRNQKAGGLLFTLKATKKSTRENKCSVKYKHDTGITYVYVKRPKTRSRSTYKFSAKTGHLSWCPEPF